MIYSFSTTNKKFYFSRDNDLVYDIAAGFIIKIKPLLEKDLNKGIVASFVLGKKVGSSVERNKIKRRLRIILNELGKIHLNTGFAYIFLIKKEIQNLSFDKLQEKIIFSLKKMFSNKKFSRYQVSLCRSTSSILQYN